MVSIEKAAERLGDQDRKCECGRPPGQCVKGDMDYCDALEDETLICPVTGNPCMPEHDQFCDDYGCARKAGVYKD